MSGMRCRALRLNERMKRRLLNLVIVLSLVLFLSTVAAWVASSSRAHVIDWGGDASAVTAGVFRGGCFVGWAWWGASERRGAGFRYRSLAASELPRRFDPVSGYATTRRFAGFGLGSTRAPQSGTTMVALPLWPFVLLSLAPPTAGWRARHRRLRRMRTERCPACGYDLRATPGRCPECGNAPGGDA